MTQLYGGFPPLYHSLDEPPRGHPLRLTACVAGRQRREHLVPHDGRLAREPTVSLGARKAHVLTTTSPPRAEEKSSLYSDPSADSKWDTKDEARYYDADDKEERNTSFVANRFLEKIEEMMDDEGQSVENIFRAWGSYVNQNE